MREYSIPPQESDIFGRAVHSIIRSAKDAMEATRQRIIKSPEEAVSAFIKDLSAGSPQTKLSGISKIEAAFNLGLNVQKAMPQLVRSLSDRNQMVRCNCASLLAKLYLEKGMVVEVKILLLNKDPGIKAATIGSLNESAVDRMDISIFISDLIIESWGKDRDIAALAYIAVYNAAVNGDYLAHYYLRWVARRCGGNA